MSQRRSPKPLKRPRAGNAHASGVWRGASRLTRLTDVTSNCGVAARIAAIQRTCRTVSLQREVHLHVNADGDRLAVLLTRLELPLLQRVDGLPVEPHVERAIDSDAVDRAVGQDDGRE